MSDVFALTLDTPLGDLVACSDGGALTALRFAEPGEGPERSQSTRCLDDLAALLGRYWGGEPVRFDLPVKLHGTPFQTKVWRALATVPYGRTISYAELARRVGSPRAMRAVGRANGANPIAIVVPCHRVIGSNGTLTGYGGGIERKRALLELEGAI
jgi:methylated-DNA-[protein]-cysteine S-methyltransferase